MSLGQLIVSQLPLITVVLQLTMATSTLNPVVITSQGAFGVCPSQEERENAIQTIKTFVQSIQESYANNITSTDADVNLNPFCGEGEWYQVANLNMSDSSQQCPSAWREYNSNGIRTCTGPDSSSGNCSGTSYSTGRQYRKVCGRAIGYQIGSTDGFGNTAAFHASIDSYYVYGVSFTHGTPRNHIWTLSSGLTEGQYPVASFNCPCADPSNTDNSVVPSFVSDNYYCESGNPTSSTAHTFYSSDPLWDGEQCEGECCSNGKSPPWFSVQLPNPTTDDIEVRICIPERIDGNDVAIELLVIYIQ